ncbi:MAG TPA: ATPase [Legionellales bacterium]|nr:ATPase [Legionellales bacterium]
MYKDLIDAYQKKDLPVIQLGEIIVDQNPIENASVNLILKQFNRHGLVAGATGSGKTKTLQVLAEQLSLAGVPSLVLDMKGDISGLAMSGVLTDKIQERSKILGLEYKPQNFPVELLSLSPNIKGVPVRATIKDFGPLLFSRLLELNDTQSGVVTILFEYANDNQLLLIDLNDFKSLLKFSQADIGQQQIEKQYGKVSGASISTIMRKIIELESQGGEHFFGEPALDVRDLLRINQDKGLISILRVMDMQDKPYLFSTFMVKLLSDLYRLLPECGDLDKPKLVLFIDEAHLIFNNANKNLLNLMDTIVKLIRSKGVGLVFCTQTPKDIPENILSQLGFKIQHVLRAFTAKDRQAMSLTAKNFPISQHYKTEELLTALGIGEALLTAIDERGAPTPLVQCMIRTPESRMGVLTEEEEVSVLSQSALNLKYHDRLERESAMEILNQKVVADEKIKNVEPEGPSAIEVIAKNPIVKQVTRDVVRKLTQLIFSYIKGKK